MEALESSLNAPPPIEELLLGELPMPVLVVDSQGLFTFANSAAAQMLGREAETLIGLVVNDISAPPAAGIARAWEAFTSETQKDGEVTLIRPDGVTIPTYFQATRNFAPNRHLLVLSDLRERRRIDTRVRENERLFLNTFAASPAPTTVLRLNNGQFIEVNEAFQQATGYWRSDVLGGTAQSVGFWKHSADFEVMLERLRDGELIESTLAVLITKDRREVLFNVALRRVDILDDPHVVAVYSEVAGAPQPAA